MLSLQKERFCFFFQTFSYLMKRTWGSNKLKSVALFVYESTTHEEFSCHMEWLDFGARCTPLLPRIIYSMKLKFTPYKSSNMSHDKNLTNGTYYPISQVLLRKQGSISLQSIVACPQDTLHNSDHYKEGLSKISLRMLSCSPSRYQCLKSLSSADSWLKVGRHVSAILGGENNPVRHYIITLKYGSHTFCVFYSYLGYLYTHAVCT